MNEVIRNLINRRIVELQSEIAVLTNELGPRGSLRKRSSKANGEAVEYSNDHLPVAEAHDAPPRTKRKMPLAQRKAVSLRMKRFWAQHRRDAK